MLRLEIMPLVTDFGEGLEHPMEKLNPNVRLKFTRDYRIFGQISNFPDSPDTPPGRIIMVRPLPGELMIAHISEEDGLTWSREDESKTGITWVYAKQLKKLEIPKDTSRVNKAIKAYLDQLPNNVPILLKWD